MADALQRREGEAVNFDREWTIFACDAEVDAYGTARIVKAHNALRAEIERLRADRERLVDMLCGYFMVGRDPDATYWEAIEDVLEDVDDACERGMRWRTAIDAAREKEKP